MIGVFDSGFGGLTVLRALALRFPNQTFLYLGDHAHVPYGARAADDVLRLTQASVEHLFAAGCRLVLLGCNTATAVAARHLQQVWLPGTDWQARGHNVLGIIAPTVEAATQTPWAVTTPQYPQKYNDDRIVVFGTERTVRSGVYAEEIGKRCPRVRVTEICVPDLVAAIEGEAGDAACRSSVARAIAQAPDADRVILGCTHFPLVEPIFRDALSPGTRILSQPSIVADSLEDYLARHPAYTQRSGWDGRSRDRDREARTGVALTTTGSPEMVNAVARVLWPEAPAFRSAEQIAFA
ncbi:MAG: aspartate/glutamate racemase family protein [Pseudomonadota bacterium]